MLVMDVVMCVGVTMIVVMMIMRIMMMVAVIMMVVRHAGDRRHRLGRLERADESARPLTQTSRRPNSAIRP